MLPFTNDVSDEYFCHFCRLAELFQKDTEQNLAHELQLLELKRTKDSSTTTSHAALRCKTCGYFSQNKVGYSSLIFSNRIKEERHCSSYGFCHVRSQATGVLKIVSAHNVGYRSVF